MSGMFQDPFPKAGEPRPISHIQCGLCHRSPTVGSCLGCGIRGCAGCIEPLTRECWACLGYGSPQDVSDDSDVHGVPNVLSVQASLFAPSGEPKSEPNTAQANLHVSTNLPSPTLPSLSWPLIFRFVGAHILQQEDWPCSQCKPSWHSWYCQRCRMCVPPAWTCQKHFGSCGQSCSCCRFERWEALGSCEECEDLWVLKATSGEVRLALLSYDGR